MSTKAGSDHESSGGNMDRHGDIFYEFDYSKHYTSIIVCPYCNKDVTGQLSGDIDAYTDDLGDGDSISDIAEKES